MGAFCTMQKKGLFENKCFKDTMLALDILCVLCCICVSMSDIQCQLHYYGDALIGSELLLNNPGGRQLGVYKYNILFRVQINTPR